MSKVISYSLITLLAVSPLYAGKKKYDLRWKVGDKPIVFKTNMKVLSVDFNYCWNPDSSDDDLDFKRLIKEISKMMGKSSHYSILSKKGDLVQVKLISHLPDKENKKDPDPEKFVPQDITSKMTEMMTGVQLRGELYKSGEIASFYTKTDQKNLLAIFFELPLNPVRVGDTWSLDVTIASLNQDFICEKFRRINRVTLKEVKKEGGELLAILDYEIYEHIRGRYSKRMVENMKMFESLSKNGKKINRKNQDVTAMIKISYKGLGTFSITKGRWKKLQGIMSSTREGFICGKSTQGFVLEPVEKYPEEILKYE